jgi:hypothetical protein
MKTFIEYIHIFLFIIFKINVNMKNLDSLNDSPYYILFYNYALLLYFKRQYDDAFKIVERLNNQYSDVVDESLSRQINFLYAELLIQLRQV